MYTEAFMSIDEKGDVQIPQKTNSRVKLII